MSLELLHVALVADRLGLSRAQVYRLISKGKMPSVRIGRAVRVPRDLLEEWIASRTSGRDQASHRAEKSK